jgi:hypothetical protein
MTSEESRKKKKHCFYWLVGGFNPPEKYESHLGLFFPIYGKIKNVPNHQPVGVLKMGGPNGWMVDFDGKSKTQMDDFGEPPGNL